MPSIGVALVMKCVAVTAKEDLGKAVLAVYVAIKDILPALHY